MTSKEIRVACFENCPGEHSTTMKYYTTVASLSWIIQSIFQHREANLDTRPGKSHENHLVVWECHKFFWWTAPRKNSIILFDLHTSKKFLQSLHGNASLSDMLRNMVKQRSSFVLESFCFLSFSLNQLPEMFNIADTARKKICNAACARYRCVIDNLAPGIIWWRPREASFHDTTWGIPIPMETNDLETNWAPL